MLYWKRSYRGRFGGFLITTGTDLAWKRSFFYQLDGNLDGLSSENILIVRRLPSSVMDRLFSGANGGEIESIQRSGSTAPEIVGRRPNLAHAVSRKSAASARSIDGVEAVFPLT